MLGMFDKVKPLLTPKPKIQVPRPDNVVFRMHYKVTQTFIHFHFPGE